MSDIHPLLHGADPPGDWRHRSVSTSVGITYDLPTGQGFDGVEVPEDRRVEVTLDIDDGDRDHADRPVTIWYVVYPPDRIMYNFRDARRIVAKEPNLKAGCETLEEWMRDPAPGERPEGSA